MKKLTLLSIFCFLFITIFSQAPQSFNYQLIARDTSGKVLANKALGIQISILTDANNGIVVYCERHSATTNNFGLASLAIGTGNIVSGSFQPIDWGKHLHFIKLEIDPVGGTNYFTMGTTQLVSVPYALYAEKAGNIVDTSNTNELQALSISHDTIFLSNGGFVKLPPSTPNVWTATGNNVSNNNSGFVGIGTENPTSALHVNGSVRITDESEGTGKVLTSDPLGNASWQAPSSGNVTGTANYVPKFTGTNSIGNSMVYETNNKMGIGTKTPTGRVVIKGDSLANDSLPLFEVQDKNGKTVLVVWPDGVHVYVNDTSACKAQNKGSFAVSGKSSAKGTTDDVFVVKPNDVHVYLDEAGAGKANNKGSFAVSGKSTAKSATNDYLSVNSDSIKASKSFYLPRLTTFERNNLGFVPSEALIIFNLTEKCMEIYENGVWSNIWCFNCAPNFIIQPNNVTICEGQDTSFTVSATGTSIVYQWQVSIDGGTLWDNIAGATSSTLLLSNIQTGQNGYKYRCYLTSSCPPDIYSNVVTLNVGGSSISITSQPSNQQTLSDCDAGFSLSTSAYGQCQWQLSYDGGNTWNDITNGGTVPTYSGATNTNLTLINIPLGFNNNKFRCMISNLCGLGTISDESVITVNAISPDALLATNVAHYSFSANWNPIGDVTGYFLDVSENSDFSTFVSGYNNRYVGNATTYSVTGLNAATTYFYRVRATPCGGGENSNIITVSTVHGFGDYYGGGWVFYVDVTGQHGLISTGMDNGTVPWGCYNTDITGADGTAIGTGEQNTIDMQAECTEWSPAKACNDLDFNGYTDWFLPSKDELNQIYINKDAIGSFGGGYWSSSEYDAINAWSQDFNYGWQGYFDKNAYFNVTCVRHF